MVSPVRVGSVFVGGKGWETTGVINLMFPFLSEGISLTILHCFGWSYNDP